MRHRNSHRKLNRTSSHRLAMLRNMTNSLLLEETIVTTLPKAKELRRVAEPLITLAKTANLANRRLAFNRTRDRAVVGKLFADLGPRFEQRPGGYIRILKYGFRAGDNAPLALVELVTAAASVAAEDITPSKKKKNLTKAGEDADTVTKSAAKSTVAVVADAAALTPDKSAAAKVKPAVSVPKDGKEIKTAPDTVAAQVPQDAADSAVKSTAKK